MIAAELKVVGGKHAGQVVPLNRRKFLIGREQDCQLRPNSDMVSRHHCVFSVDDFSVRLRDLGSTNGTIVNGERIRRETVLTSGDRIVIGNLEFELAVRVGTSVPEADSKAIPVTALVHEDTQVNSKTNFEMPATTIASSAEPSMTQSVPVPTAPQADPIAQTVSASADTTMISPGQMMPGQYPYQPMMQPMAFPGQMYGGFPYQPMMPGFGQMYPGMMPQMGYPMPGVQMPAGTAAPPAPAAAPSAIAVSLPDPESTGAKEADPAKGSAGATKDAAKPTGAADSIIKQYMGRRPGS
jgi:predicted component of type VI protein secretion system